MRNWSGHVEFTSARIESPPTTAELQSLVSGSDRIRALGTAHSFNAIADTIGVHVSVASLPGGIEIDAEQALAWVPAGMRYGEAARLLDARGWAVHNMASLGHISVAGTIATGTHGSGDRNPTLSASVAGLEMVTAAGDLISLTRDDPDFAGCVVALGALGVTTRVLLRVEPAYEVRQYVIDDVSHESLLTGFEEVFSSAYSVSFFTTWAADLTGKIWMKRREGRDAPLTSPQLAGEPWLGGRLAAAKRHPLPEHDAMHCTEQQGALLPWHEALPHFKLDFTPSSGDELQTEYLVPRDRAVGLLRELEALAPRIHPLLHVSEIRTMCADDLWLSGAYGRDTVGIHFTWKKVPEALGLLPEVDALLGPAGGRPHWGKLYDTGASRLADRYPRFDDFARLADAFDPGRKFRNPTLDTLLGSRHVDHVRH
ncbi:MAG: FAD-binding protein [Actinobacteria bacterium]|nr:FAD-binding protein [Actinomycetota bacterium]